MTPQTQRRSRSCRYCTTKIDNIRQVCDECKRCSVVVHGEPCSNRAQARRLCTGHYRQWALGLDFTELRKVYRVRDGMKMCARCATVLPVADFGKKLNYTTEMCRPCRSIDLRAKAYGLTRGEVIEMLGRPCGACGAVVSGRELHIDHCHESGVVRGVLCHGCNTALGLVNESPTVLRALADYIERF